MWNFDSAVEQVFSLLQKVVLIYYDRQAFPVEAIINNHI